MPAYGLGQPPRSAVWCCDGATNLWTIKIKSSYMLWSQYKLATMRRSEFLRKQITGIPNIANQNSNFLTLQTSKFQKIIPTGIFGIYNGIGIPLTRGSQKSEPKIRIPNQASAFCVFREQQFSQVFPKKHLYFSTPTT